MNKKLTCLALLFFCGCAHKQSQNSAIPLLPPPPPEAPAPGVAAQDLQTPSSTSPAPDPLTNSKLGMSVVKRNCKKIQTKFNGNVIYNESCDTEIFVRLRFICLNKDRKPVPQVLIESEATRYNARLGSSQKGSGESFKLTGFKSIKGSLLEISIANPNHPKLQLQELTISVGNQKYALNPTQLSQPLFLEPQECTNFLPDPNTSPE